MQTISFGQLLLNRIKRHPITSILLAINLIMFFVVSFNGGFNQASLIKNGGLVPTLVSQGEVWRILTAMFLHAGFLHFFMNSFFLYYIGSFMERILGSLKYTVLYFASGIGSGIFVWLLSTPGIPTIGASGALFGIMAGLFLMTFLRPLWFHPASIRSIRTMVMINLFFTFVSMIYDLSISVWGHLGGFAVGLVVAYFLMPDKPHLVNRAHRPQETRRSTHHGRTIIDADDVTDDDIYDSNYTN